MAADDTAIAPPMPVAAGAEEPGRRFATLKLVTIMGLVIAQEVPKIVAGTALPAFYRDAGMDLERFWVFSLIMVPYWLKWLVAPMVDRYNIPSLGRRKSWIVPLTLLAATTFLLLGFVPPTLELLWPLMALLMVNAILMATQDVAVDGYITDALDDTDRDLGTSLGFMASRIAYVVATAGIMSLYGAVGWQAAITVAALLLVLLTLPAALRREPRPRVPSTGVPSLRQFVSRPEAGKLALLQTVSGFASNFAFGLWGAFLIDKQFTVTEVGLANGVPSIFVGVAAAFMSEWMLRRIGIKGTLRIGIVLCGAAHAAAFWLAGFDRPSLWHGMAVYGLFDLLQYPVYVVMASTRLRWSVGRQSATDVTIQGSCANFGMTIAGAAIGFAAAKLGWSGFFLLSGAITTLVILLYLRLFDGVEAAHQTRLARAAADASVSRTTA